ncbi:MAG TPA: ribokinase [Thermomicrobiales bacterium]
MSEPSVAVLGSLHMDLIAVAERLPSHGESLLGERFSMQPGGKAGNQATQVALCGIRSFLISRVGEDTLGVELRARLSAKGVDLSYVQIDGEVPTGASPILIGRDGEYASIIVPGASARLNPEDVERTRSAIEASRALMLQLEVSAAVSAKAAAIARQAGAMVILNASPLPARPMVELPSELVRHVDLLIANRREAERLAGGAINDPDDALRAGRSLKERLGCPAIVITLGEVGAVAIDRDTAFYSPSLAVEVVDTVGAGDAFAGTLVAQMIRGHRLVDAMRYAVVAGALATTKSGAFDALPTFDEIERALGGESGVAPR